VGQYHPPPIQPKAPEFSKGYAPGEVAVGYDPTTDAGVIKKAIRTSSVPPTVDPSNALTQPPGDTKMDLDALLKILPKLTPLQVEALKPHLGTTPQDLARATDDVVKIGVIGLLMGPKDFDAFMLHYALSDNGKPKPKSKLNFTFKDTWILSLVLLDRKSGDIEAIKDSYRRRYGDNLLHLIKEALRKEPLLGNLYMNVLENRVNPGVSEVDDPAAKNALQTAIDKDADELFTATVGTIEGNKFAWIFTTSSRQRLKEVAEAYKKRQGVALLEAVTKKLKKLDEFKDELSYILMGLDDDLRAKRDAQLLENTMKGFGTPPILPKPRFFSP